MSQAPYADAQFLPEDVQPERPTGRPRPRWLWGVVAAVLLVAVGVTTWLLVPRFLSGDEAAAAAEDIVEQPEITWTYRFAERGQEEWLAASPTLWAASDDRVVVLAPVDSAALAQESDPRWYVGYDEHYTEGFTAGTAYNEDLEAYRDDFVGKDYPYQDDYYTGEAGFAAAVDDPGQVGWFDGFDDAQFGRAEGDGAAQAPVTPPTTGHLVVLDVGSGREVWALELEALQIDPAQTSVTLLSTPADGPLLLSATTSTGAGTTTEVLAVDAGNGDVLGRRVLDEGSQVSASQEDEGALVEWSDWGVTRWDPADLGGQPIWSAGIGAVNGVAGDGEYVVAYTQDGQIWLDAATGFEPPWFTGGDPEVNYQLVGDVVLQLESSSFGSYIDALDSDGDTLWTGDAERVHVASGPEGDILLTSEVSEDGGNEYLERIDPRTGDRVWEQAYDETFTEVRGNVDGLLVVHEGDRSVTVDVETGERQQRMRGLATWLGSSTAYGTDDGGLRAWSTEDAGQLWTHRLTDGAGPRLVDGRFYIVDTARFELGLLQ